MADAIWNNNYILSNMDAQKLYAQSPLTTGVSGTSAYIGIEPSAQYNETVLWEGASTNTAFSLSEPITNFEYILLSNSALPAPAVIVKVEASYSAKFGYARSWMSDDNTCHYRFYSVTSTNGKDFVNRYTRGIDYTTAMAESHGGGADWHLENTQVVGINRKENA